eukprot:4238506-Amphidinium_carterae.1
MVIAVEIGCALHDLHNSLKWCYQSLFPDTDDSLQNMFIGFNTLKSGMAVVLHGLGGWLLKSLLPLGEADLPSREELVEFFSALGVDGADVEVLSACKLLWCPRRQKLMVSREFLSTAASVNMLSSLLFGCWKFNRFCGSRWLTMG